MAFKVISHLRIQFNLLRERLLILALHSFVVHVVGGLHVLSGRRHFVRIGRRLAALLETIVIVVRKEAILVLLLVLHQLSGVEVDFVVISTLSALRLPTESESLR